jgi:hypothetical protein
MTSASSSTVQISRASPWGEPWTQDLSRVA